MDLVNIQTMEKHHAIRGKKSLFLWPFSTAMSNYQRAGLRIRGPYGSQNWEWPGIPVKHGPFGGTIFSGKPSLWSDGCVSSFAEISRSCETRGPKESLPGHLHFKEPQVLLRHRFHVGTGRQEKWAAKREKGDVCCRCLYQVKRIEMVKSINQKTKLNAWQLLCSLCCSCCFHRTKAGPLVWWVWIPRTIAQFRGHDMQREQVTCWLWPPRNKQPATSIAAIASHVEALHAISCHYVKQL